MTKFLFGLLIFASTVFAGTPCFAETPEEYFNRFIYSGTCPKSDETAMIDTVMTKVSPTLSASATGEARIAKIELQLFADGSYYAKYGEWFEFFGSSGGYSLPDLIKAVEGKWHVDGSELVVEGMGVGYRITDDTFKFLLRNTIVSPVKELYFVLGKGKTNMGPKHACN